MSIIFVYSTADTIAGMLVAVTDRRKSTFVLSKEGTCLKS